MFGRKRVIEFRIEIVVGPDDVGFHAYCPALKGLHTYGDTEDEALQNIRDAAVAYLRSSIKHGDPIPLGIIHEHEVATGASQQTVRRTEELAISCVT